MRTGGIVGTGAKHLSCGIFGTLNFGVKLSFSTLTFKSLITT